MPTTEDRLLPPPENRQTNAPGDWPDNRAWPQGPQQPDEPWVLEYSTYVRYYAESFETRREALAHAYWSEDEGAMIPTGLVGPEGVNLQGEAFRAVLNEYRVES